MFIQGVSDLMYLLLRRVVDAMEHRGGVVDDLANTVGGKDQEVF